MDDLIGVTTHTHHSKVRSIPPDPMGFSAAPAELGCHAHEPRSITQAPLSESVTDVQKQCQNVHWECSMESGWVKDTFKLIFWVDLLDYYTLLFVSHTSEVALKFNRNLVHC